MPAGTRQGRDTTAVGRQLHISKFAREQDTDPKPESGTWAEFCAAFSQHERRASKDGGRLWSPATYRPGATRAKGNVASVDLLVLDLDDSSRTAEEWQERWRGRAYLLHSTFRHDSAGPRKFRAIFPLTSDIAGAAWDAFFPAAARKLAGDEFDAACSDASRMYYVPACRPDATPIVVIGDGSWLDPAEVIDGPDATEPRTPPLIADGRRHGAVCTLAGAMAHEGIPREVTTRILTRAVEKHTSKNDVRDTENVVRDIYRREASKQDAETSQAPEFDSSLLLKAKREKGNQPAAVGWQLQSIAEIYSEPAPAITWLWDGVLPMGGSSLFVGRPKSGKSTAARDLTARIVRGDGEWLGRKLLGGPAVYLALQDRKGNVCDQLRRLGVPADAPLFLHHGRPPKGAIEDILQPILEMYRPVLLVLDTLAPILNAADLADYAETDRLIATITDLARNFGTHIMATHHSTKGGAQSDDETSVLGSTALSGGVDTMLLLKRSNGLRTLASIQREGEDLESVAVRLDKETGRLELAGTVEAIVLDHAVEAVIRKVDATPMLESDLCRAVGGNNVTTRKAIRAAFDRGLLQREGTGKKGSPFRYSIPNARFPLCESEKESIQ